MQQKHTRKPAAPQPLIFTFDPFQAVMYEQGHFHGLAGNALDYPQLEPFNHPQFILGWQHAQQDITAVFSTNVATIALHRQVQHA